MFDPYLLLKSLAMGLAVAAPMGPMSVILIRRTLDRGYLAGLSGGLGIAAADGFYGAVAAFGLTAISAALVEHQFWLRLVGGAFLVWLGLKIFFAESREPRRHGRRARTGRRVFHHARPDADQPHDDPVLRRDLRQLGPR